MFRATFLKSISLFAIAIIGITGWGEDCATLDDSVRLSTQQDVDNFQNVCEITGNLGIFVDGVVQITLPKLKRAKIINIESHDLQAVGLPVLEKVSSLYVSGGNLQLVELGELGSVNNVLAFRTRRLKLINLPKLGSVGKLLMEGNLSLEFVFADSLYQIGASEIHNNPLLNSGSEAMLEQLTHVMSDEEKDYIKRAQDEEETLKKLLLEKKVFAPPMRPTGQDPYEGMAAYYRWYPYYYYHYWQNVEYWGYAPFY